MDVIRSRWGGHDTRGHPGREPAGVCALSWLGRKKRDKDAVLKDAFMDVVFVHADGLFRYALRLAGDPDTAADLVQETFTRAFDAFDRLRPNTNHRAWTFTILRNAFLSRMRRAAREEILADPELTLPTLLGAEAANVPALDARGFEDSVVSALDTLPEPQRTAVLLCDVEEMSYEEIAQVMECPVGTVRSRIHHARRRLRELLAGHAKEKGYG